MRRKNFKRNFIAILIAAMFAMLHLSGTTVNAAPKLISETINYASTSSSKANFYLYKPYSYDETTGYVSPFTCDWVGSGYITSPSIIYNDAAAVSNIIISAPTVDGTDIEWVTAFTYFGRNVIIGKIVTYLSEIDEIIEDEIEDNTSEIIEESIDNELEISDSSDATDSESTDITNEEPTTDITDDTTEEVIEEEPEPQLYVLDRNAILSASKANFNEGDSVKWDSFRAQGRDVCDGVIPVSLLDDPVYTSMNLPSESRSDYLIKANRDNGHILGDTSSPDAQKIVSIGSIYQTSGTTLPDEITICIGKIKLFGYSTSTNQWVTISSDSAPADAMIYRIPWSSGVIKCDNKQIYDDHMEVTVSGADLAGNTLHFWGTKVPFDKTQYAYYACAYTYWVKGDENSNLLTSVIAMDIKASTGTNTIAQLISSRGMSVQPYQKTIWGTTIPNSVYDPNWGYELQNLFNE